MKGIDPRQFPGMGKGINWDEIDLSSPLPLSVLPGPDAKLSRGDGSGQTKMYGNKKCEADGYKFDSHKERDRYYELKLMARSGAITELKIHPVYAIVIGDVLVYTYTPDSRYMEAGALVVEDVKSKATAAAKYYRVVKKLMRAVYGIDVRVLIR